MTTAKRVERKDRVPVSGAKDILTVKNKDPNYEYRWVYDTPGRVERYKEGGYEVVTENLEIGQKQVGQETKLGSAITKRSGVGTLVLMRIPKEWYDEDQAAKQERVDALEDSMREDVRRGQIPGSQEPGYTPDGGGLKISRRK
jgi:hypothetical protein